MSGWDLLALPVVSEVRFFHEHTAYDFAEWARRGLYAFDWKDGGRVAGRTGDYERCTAPVTPAALADLPPALATRAACCQLPLQFAETASIRVGDFVPVVTSGRGA